MTLRNNRFIGCGIKINPESRSESPDEQVHQNIHILNNFSDGAGISAHHVRGLTITGNRVPAGEIPLTLAPTCTDVITKDNERKADQ